MLKVLDTGKNSASKNMLLDEELLDNLKLNDEPILHFYDWEKKSATYGYFTKLNNFLNLKKAKELGLDLAKRPTGGGIIFHIWDFAFSFLMPSSHKNFSSNTLENYKIVNEIVLNSIKTFLHPKDHLKFVEEEKTFFKTCENFCMAKLTKFDVAIQNKKIIGASQRKKKNGLLHQGSISLCFPDEAFLKEIILDENVLKSILIHTHSLLGKVSQKKLELVRKELSMNLIQEFQKRFV
jgi:lipoate---protein ligase